MELGRVSGTALAPRRLRMPARTASERVALHEAAHVVVARACGYEVHRVEIRPDGTGACWAAVAKRSSLESIVAELGYALAGKAAVELDAGRSLWGWGFRRLHILERELAEWPGGVDGVHRSIDALGYAGRSGPIFDNIIGQAVLEVERVLRARWGELTKLAARLLDEGSIDFFADAERELDRRHAEHEAPRVKQRLELSAARTHGVRAAVSYPAPNRTRRATFVLTRPT